MKKMMTCFFFPWIALLLFILISISNGSCWERNNKDVDMTKDFDVLVGSAFVLNCTLLNESIMINGEKYYVNASYITFEKGKTLVKNAETIVINSLKSQLRINYSKIEDSGMYNCIIKPPNYNESLVGCVTKVSVGYKPTHVKDFSCKSIYYKKLKCTWRIKPTYIETSSILYQTPYINYGMNTTLNCPSRITPNNYNYGCQWALDSNPVYDRIYPKYFFLITTNNSLGSINDTFWIDHNKIVLPDKPRDLKFRKLNSTELELEWNSPDEMDDFLPHLIYQLLYYKVNENVNRHIKIINITSKETHVVYSIKNLIPFTQYKFALRCRSNVSEGEDMWSENTTLVVLTKEDVPNKVPEITKEAFEIQQYGNNYTITIYWKHVPEEFRNGRNFKYVVSYISTNALYKEDSILSFNNTINSSSSFVTFSNLDASIGYKFKIYSANNKGFSEKFSTITINKSENLLPVPKDITVISYDQGHYKISWKPVYKASDPVKSYTVFWCTYHQNQIFRPFPCNGSIHWKYVSDGITSIKLNLADFQTNFQFAVSANSEYSTSGMEWAPCIIPSNNTIVKIREPFSLEAKNSSTIHISWNFDCNAQKALIKKFYIFYCRTEDKQGKCSGKMHNHTLLNNSAEDFYITGLTANTYYRIFIRIVTTDNKKVDSGHQYIYTLSGGLTSEMVVSIIIGVTLTCVILTVIIWFIVKRIKKKFDLLRKLKIRLPTGLDMPNKDTLGYENFKKGLFQENTSLPPLKSRPGSFVLDNNKNKCISQLSNSSAEELLYKTSGRCDSYWRNPSGDSSSGCSSNGIHDSISSSNTNHTHLSTDSGTELDISTVNTNDNVFCDPSLILKSNVSSKVGVQDDNSNDFGLDKETSINCELEIQTHSIPNSNIILSMNDSQLKQHSYSKFGLTGINSQCFKQWNNVLAINYNLCNSEPSIININENSNDQNKSVALIPYSKVGISKSSESIDHYHLNKQEYIENEKFVNSAIESIDSKLSKYSDVNLQSKNNYHNNNLKPYVSMKSYFENVLKVSDCKEGLYTDLKDNENMAYSKFDIQPSIQTISSQITNSQINPYVPVQQAHSMLQGVILPDISVQSSFDVNLFKYNNDLLPEKLSLSEVNFVEEILNSPDKNLYLSKEQIKYENPCTYGCDKSFDNNRIDLDSEECNLQREKSDVTEIEDTKVEKSESCYREEPYKKFKYVNENNIVPEESSHGVIMSPQQLDCDTTYISPYRLNEQLSDNKTTNNENGYVHLSTVYYV